MVGTDPVGAAVDDIIKLACAVGSDGIFSFVSTDRIVMESCVEAASGSALSALPECSKDTIESTALSTSFAADTATDGASPCGVAICTDEIPSGAEAASAEGGAAPAKSAESIN